MDVDKLAVVHEGQTIATIDANVEEHGAPIGGQVVVRGHGGAAVGVLSGGDEHAPIGSLLLQNGAVSIFGGGGKFRVNLHPGDQLQGQDGGTIELSAKDDSGKPPPGGGPPRSAIELNAATRSITIGAPSGAIVARLDAAGDLKLGGANRDGDIALFRGDAQSHDPAAATCHVDGNDANIWLGGNGADGDIAVFGTGAKDNHDLKQATFHVDGERGNVWLGGNGVDGDLVVFPASATDNHDTGAATAHIDGEEANIWLGGNGTDGDIMLFSNTATNNHDASAASIHLDGNAGDITLRNADCAEEFDLAGEAVEPGTVVALDDGGRVGRCTTAYDTRVAGVVSGAGDHRPGIVLDRRREAGRPRAVVALMGKVFCRVDARHGPIEVGSLLTTSDTPGCAMRAADPGRAFGAVLGKALAAHREGVGLIPVLVALQ